MKKMLVMSVVVGAAISLASLTRSCSAEEKILNHLPEWSMTSRIVTNELSESEYNTRTNGHKRIDEHGAVWANNIVFVTSATNSFYYATTNMRWVSYNTTCVKAPDPFEKKITVKYFTEELEKKYVLHIGPLQNDYATVKTVLKRWKTRHVQKLNMTERTEKVTE